MSWQAIQLELLESCKPLLEPRGYKLVKSRSSFEKPTAGGRLIIRLLFVASDVGNRSVQIGCGVRNDAIEQIVSQGAPPATGAAAIPTTLHAEWSHRFWLNSVEEQEEAASRLRQYVRETALPFLEREYSLGDFSALLNVTDVAGKPIERIGMGVRFWQRGLAAARLANDPRFESLRRHYTQHLRALSNGCYLSEFQRCLKYLDERMGQAEP